MPNKSRKSSLVYTPLICHERQSSGASGPLFLCKHFQTNCLSSSYINCISTECRRDLSDLTSIRRPAGIPARAQTFKI